MTQGFTAAFSGGLFSAVLYAAVTGGSLGALILAYLTPLPLFLAGLGFGTQTALVAGVTGSVLVLGITGSPVATAVFALGNAVPVWYIVRQSLQSREWHGGLAWYPPGPLLTSLTLGGVVVLAVAFLSAWSLDGGLIGLSGDFIRETVGNVPGVDAMGGSAGDLAAALAPVLPGGVMLSWLLMLIGNGLLAQGLLLRFGRALRPPMRMAELHLPGWLDAGFVVAAAGGLLLPGQVGQLSGNAAMLLALPVFFAGLAVVHAFAAQRPSRGLFLVAFYIALFLFGWPAVVVVGLGLADQWLDLRRRLSVRQARPED